MAANYAKFGLDANQPIDSRGNIARRLQNPDWIVNSGAHWLRLNFVLPNTGFLDRYDTIVNSFTGRDMKIYATIGHDAIRDNWLGDKLRDPSSSDAEGWIRAYAERFKQIVDRYQGKIFVYEAINEPNGWQGGDRALIHPRWFATLMNTLYRTIHPRERGIHLISGPLEATWVNNNEGAEYLRKVYLAGSWSPGTIPWDGIGYHLYLGEDPASPRGTPGSIDAGDIRQSYHAFMNKLWGVMNYYDPQTRHLIFVSEFGWSSDLGEDYQARQNALGMELLASDDRVAVASLFCAEDFSKKYGLYTEGMGSPKRAFATFRQTMQTRAPVRSRQVDLRALEGPVNVPVVQPPGGGAQWAVGPGLMRHPVQRRLVILLPPYDDGRWARAVLDAGYFGQGGVTLCWSPGEAGLTIAGEERIVLVVNPAEWSTPDGSLVPWFRRNTPGVKVREETFLTPKALADWLRATPNPFTGAQ